MISRLATPLFVKLAMIGGGAMLGVIAILMLLLHSERQRSEELTTARAQVIAGHEVTRAGLRVCREALDRSNAEADAQAARLERDRAASREAVRAADAAAVASRQRAERLRNQPVTAANRQCQTPEDMHVAAQNL